MIKLFDDDWIQKSFWNAERYNIRQEERAEAQKKVKAAEEKTKAAKEETKAIKEAFSEKQKASALKMLEKGVLSIEEIADFTGLSVKTVKVLAEKK